jgi:hypothetical protein
LNRLIEQSHPDGDAAPVELQALLSSLKEGKALPTMSSSIALQPLAPTEALTATDKVLFHCSLICNLLHLLSNISNAR